MQNKTRAILHTTLNKPKCAVGPNGKWQTTKRFGMPRCSYTKTTSVNSCARQDSIISESTCKGHEKLDLDTLKFKSVLRFILIRGSLILYHIRETVEGTKDNALK